MSEIIKVDQHHAEVVLRNVEQELNAVQNAMGTLEKSFARLAILLVEVKRGALWSFKGYKNETEWIDKVFPQSPAQYYDLVKIGTQLQSLDIKTLEEIGRSKCGQLARIAAHNNGAVPQEWIEKALTQTSAEFKKSVKEYFGKKEQIQSEEDSGAAKESIKDQFITFRIFGDDIHIVHTAFERLAQLAGSEKSMGHRLGLLCADFLSEFDEDGVGRLQGKNAYILRIISRLLDQLDLSDEDVVNKIFGMLAAKFKNEDEVS